MDRKTALDRLSACADDLRAQGVGALYLFGSTARDQAGVASDVDLFFDYTDPRFSLVELVRIRQQIAEILGIEANVMNPGQPPSPAQRADRIERNASVLMMAEPGIYLHDRRGRNVSDKRAPK